MADGATTMTPDRFVSPSSLLPVHQLVATGIVACLHQRRQSPCICFVCSGATWEFGDVSACQCAAPPDARPQYLQRQYPRHCTTTSLQPVCAQLSSIKTRRVIDRLTETSVHPAHVRDSWRPQCTLHMRASWRLIRSFDWPAASVLRTIYVVGKISAKGKSPIGAQPTNRRVLNSHSVAALHFTPTGA